MDNRVHGIPQRKTTFGKRLRDLYFEPHLSGMTDGSVGAAVVDIIHLVRFGCHALVAWLVDDSLWNQPKNKTAF